MPLASQTSFEPCEEQLFLLDVDKEQFLFRCGGTLEVREIKSFAYNCDHVCVLNLNLGGSFQINHTHGSLMPCKNSEALQINRTDILLCLAKSTFYHQVLTIVPEMCLNVYSRIRLFSKKGKKAT